jgi:hypothetical protein
MYLRLVYDLYQLKGARLSPELTELDINTLVVSDCCNTFVMELFGQAQCKL